MQTERRTLDDIAPLAQLIVERVIWCTVATTGPDGAPRTRLMHPVWRWDGEAPCALVTARPTPLKRRHLRHSPAVSCFYWSPAHDTVAIDAVAEWLGADERAAAWEAIRAVPAPVGFDPAMIWPDGPTAPDAAVLRFVAHRIIATRAGQPASRWDR